MLAGVGQRLDECTFLTHSTYNLSACALTPYILCYQRQSNSAHLYTLIIYTSYDTYKKYNKCNKYNKYNGYNKYNKYNKYKYNIINII